MSYEQSKRLDEFLSHGTFFDVSCPQELGAVFVDHVRGLVTLPDGSKHPFMLSHEHEWFIRK